MKKLVLIGLMGLVAGSANASDWQEKPLPVNYSTPQPMGEPVVSTVKSKSNRSSANSSLIGLAVFAGYSGYNAKPDYEEKQKLNGFELGASYSWGKFGLFEKYEHQNESQVKYNELSTGIQYKFLEQHDFYLMSTAALGYGWGETKETKIDLEFLTLPVGLEAGYSFAPNFDLYGGVGYKWLWDRSKNEGCSMYVCWSGRGEVVGDLDGVTYKAGLRYNF